jgi:hypothetical protein
MLHFPPHLPHHPNQLHRTCTALPTQPLPPPLQTPAEWAYRMFRYNPSYVVGELFMPGAEVLHRHGVEPLVVQQYLAPVIMACTQMFNRPKLKLLMTMEVAFMMLQQVGAARACGTVHVRCCHVTWPSWCSSRWGLLRGLAARSAQLSSTQPAMYTPGPDACACCCWMPCSPCPPPASLTAGLPRRGLRQAEGVLPHGQEDAGQLAAQRHGAPAARPGAAPEVVSGMGCLLCGCRRALLLVVLLSAPAACTAPRCTPAMLAQHPAATLLSLARWVCC